MSWAHREQDATPEKLNTSYYWTDLSPHQTYKSVHRLYWLQESLQLSAICMDTGMVGTQQYQLDTRNLINKSMGLQNKTLEANSKPIAQVIIKWSIYQGETPSTLMFGISLNSLSHIIITSGHCYCLQTQQALAFSTMWMTSSCMLGLSRDPT